MSSDKIPTLSSALSRVLRVAIGRIEPPSSDSLAMFIRAWDRGDA